MGALASKRVLIMVWFNRTVRLVTLCMNVPTADTSAGAVHDALDNCSQVVEVGKEVQEILRTGRFSSRLLGCDGAYGNVRYYHWHAADVAEVPEEMYPCGNHRTHAIEVGVTVPSGREMIRNLYATLVFMRQGSNFLRAIATLRLAVDQPPS